MHNDAATIFHESVCCEYSESTLNQNSNQTLADIHAECALDSCINCDVIAIKPIFLHRCDVQNMPVFHEQIFGRELINFIRRIESDNDRAVACNGVKTADQRDGEGRRREHDELQRNTSNIADSVIIPNRLFGDHTAHRDGRI